MATSKSKNKVVSKELIMEAFMEWCLENNKYPESFYPLQKQTGIAESEIYQYFNSSKQILQEIWENQHIQTVDMLQKSEEFSSYSGREKILAYYFSWIEHLMQHRSFFLFSLQQDKKPSLKKPSWVQHQIEFFDSVLQESMQNGEIESRKFISEKYKEAFGLNSMFILKQWEKDESTKFQTTDQAIEKSVNLVFDLLGKSPLDSMIDFGKFLFKQKTF